MATTKTIPITALPDPTLRRILGEFDHEQIYTLARNSGIPRGQDKTDTIANLASAEGLLALHEAKTMLIVTIP